MHRYVREFKPFKRDDVKTDYEQWVDIQVIVDHIWQLHEESMHCSDYVNIHVPSSHMFIAFVGAYLL